MVTKYATNITSEAKNASLHYQQWYNITNLSKSGSVAECGQRVTGNTTLSIGSKAGTYNKPAPITLKGFGFDLPNGTKIEKVIVHYAQQKHSVSSSQGLSTFINIGGARITLLGTSQTVTGVAVPTNYTHSTLEFESITLEQVNSDEFGLKFEYPANSNGNTGTITLGDVYIEIITSVPRVTVSSSTNTSKFVKGTRFDVTFDVTRLENLAFSPKCVITWDEGLVYVQKVQGVGTLTTNEDTNSFDWNSTFTSGNSNKTTLKFRCDKVGVLNIRITDTISNQTYTLPVTVIDYVTTVSTTLNKSNVPFKVDVQTNYDISIVTTNPVLTNQTIKINLPLGTDIVNFATLQSSYNATKTNNSTNTVLTLTAKINNLKANIPMSVKFMNSGTFTQEILIGDTSVNNTTFIVQSSQIGKLGFSRIKLPEEITENMGQGVQYVIITLARYVYDGTGEIKDYKNNLRIGTFHNSETLTTNEQKFIDNVVWNGTIATKKYVLMRNYIRYNPNYPVYIVYAHYYMGDAISQEIKYDFTEPVIMEFAHYKKLEKYKEFPKPIKALLGNSDFAECVVNAQESTAPILLYNFDSGGLFSLDSFICQGITINGNYNVSGDVELQLELVVNGKTGFRNKILEKGNGIFTLGNKYDLFGLKPHDLRNNMNNMEIWLTVYNPYDNEALVELNDININISYFHTTNTGYGFEIEGERSEEYGIYFTGVDYNVGTKNELKMYQVPGTDDTIPYRMNITDKEITLEIGLDDCEIEETMLMVDKVVKLFTNKRHQLTNKPELKSIIFDVMPDRRFWFVREDDIESEWGADSFDGKIKLVIPSGTAQSIEKTVTGSSGANRGNVAVTPIVNCISKTGGSINITERNRGQTVIINNEDGKIGVGDKIIIDNEQPHKVLLQKKGTNTETDITDDVNYSTTWFSLHDEYYFESDDVIITSVEYYEEW